MRLQARAVVAAVMAAVTVVIGGTAGAAHWPMFGGDAGRAGYQAVSPAGVPVDERWTHEITAGVDAGVRTSIITTAGEPADQRLIYGTDDGRIHLFGLLSGTRVGPAGGVDVSNEPFPFGSGAGSVTPVETSSPSSLGQVFAVHNDTAGIEIAQVDQASGALVKEVPVAGSAGFEVNSSALLTGSGSTRTLWFVAADGGDSRLWRVPITDATATTAVIGVAASTVSLNATPIASPSLVHLSDGAGGSDPWIAIGTIDGWIRTVSLDSALIPGPAGEVAGSLAIHTPSAPVDDSGVARMPVPALFAAGTNSGLTGAFRVVQSSGDPMVLEVGASVTGLAGTAAPALSTNPEAGIDGDGAGRVFVTTGANLFVLKATDMTVVAKLAAADDLVAASTGFSYTTALASGDILLVTRDNGTQLVLDAATAQPVSASDFTQNEANNGSTRAFGQPALSHRYAQFASDKGVFVYRTSAAAPTGYWQVASDGGVFNFGTAAFHGSLGHLVLNKPIVGMGATSTGAGYWQVASDGGVFAFGDAGFFGSTGNITLNSPIVGFVPTPSDRGYWLVAADGGVFAFGDAGFFGSTGHIALNKPIVGMAATPTGTGYWLVASDGGVFAFGTAAFHGSTGDITLNKPIVAMAALSSGKGYWLFATDGGVFAFGDAGFFGSTGNIALNNPIGAAAASPTGKGYLLSASDGGVFVFGDAPFFGAAAQFGPLNQPVVAIAVH